MNDPEIVQHIAEKIIGWRVVYSLVNLPIDKPGTPLLYIEPEGATVITDDDWRVWNPLADLNACAEFEEKMPPERIISYLIALGAEVQGNSPYPPNDWQMIRATPRQRCLAAVEATK